jgi:hypothetical protein
MIAVGGGMPTDRPPYSETGKPEPIEQPVRPEPASPPKGAQDASSDQAQPEREKRIERFRER